MVPFNPISALLAPVVTDDLIDDDVVVVVVDVDDDDEVHDVADDGDVIGVAYTMIGRIDDAMRMLKRALDADKSFVEARLFFRPCFLDLIAFTYSFNSIFY